jgi:hypothetical protein
MFFQFTVGVALLVIGICLYMVAQYMKRHS